LHIKTFVERNFSVKKGVFSMLTAIIAVKGTSKCRAWFWRRGAFPLLLALLMLSFIGVGTGAARSSAQLRPATVSGQHADSAPAMEVFNGTMYISWTGRNAAHNLILMTYNTTTRIFGPAHVLTETTLAGSGPALAAWNNNLYIAWRGTDNRLNVGRYNPANPTHLANKVTLNEHSNNAPSLRGFSIILYLGWRGTDGRLNIIASQDGSHFDEPDKNTFSTIIKTSPSLCTFGGGSHLFIAWEDMSASSHINVALYDPTGLWEKFTLTSTSQLPVSVAPLTSQPYWVSVAWRTANNTHIHLGIFEQGISTTLQKPVNTTETTPYAPALTSYGGTFYMSWTGTDAAQSINVSPVNI
jgi:hypothetical protein